MRENFNILQTINHSYPLFYSPLFLHECEKQIFELKGEKTPPKNYMAADVIKGRKENITKFCLQPSAKLCKH